MWLQYPFREILKLSRRQCMFLCIKYGGCTVCWISGTLLEAILLTLRQKIKIQQKSAFNNVGKQNAKFIILNKQQVNTSVLLTHY